MGEAAPKESSMEDILSSIRKIINGQDDADGEGAGADGKKASTAYDSAPKTGSTPERDMRAEKPSTPLKGNGETRSPGTLADLKASIGAGRPAETKPAGTEEKNAAPKPAPAGSLAGLAENLASGGSAEKPSSGGSGSLAGLARDLGSAGSAGNAASAKPAAAGSLSALAEDFRSGADIGKIASEIESMSAEEVEPTEIGEPSASAADEASNPVGMSLKNLAERFGETGSGRESGERDIASREAPTPEQESNSMALKKESESFDEAAEAPKAGKSLGDIALDETRPAHADDDSADIAKDEEVQEFAPETVSEPEPVMTQENQMPEAEIEETSAAEAVSADVEEEFREALVSPATTAAVASSIKRLREAIETNHAAKVETMLKPMLKEWLDENLPGMVEKLVQEEIDKIASGD